MMKIVFASDSFKGTLTSKKIAELLVRAAAEIFPGCETVPVVLADGGEGTLDALLCAGNGKKIPVTVHDPLMRECVAYYGVLGEREAVLEMAQASGLTLLSPEERNPFCSSSYGTGELIRAALESGYRNITVAIGGSATNDGGMGAADALGVRFFDSDGERLEGRGENLGRVKRIDMSGLMPEVKSARIRVMCDVRNPLCGPNGATYVYGPQKGASDDIIKELEEGMQNYRNVLMTATSIDPDTIEGAGAAGGMGAMLKLILGAELRSGIESILDLVHFDELIKDADLIITGEGRLDGQSSIGKAVQGVGLRAAKAGVPCVALCGCTGEGYEQIFNYGITRVETLVNDDVTLEYAMEHAEEVYYQKALEIFSSLDIKV